MAKLSKSKKYSTYVNPALLRLFIVEHAQRAVVAVRILASSTERGGC
jgi:hypothetical protein